MSAPSWAQRPDPGLAARRRAQLAAFNALRPYSRVRHFDRILEQRQVQPVYQPILDLKTNDVLAYEALARGPRDTPLERPDLLFGTARDLGLVSELDWVCRSTAMDTAMQSGFPSTLTLFVNVEPDVAATRAPDDLYLILKRAERDLRVVLEVTERALLERPAELLHWLRYARERWWGVALDDVGCNPESLALLPFVRPDVIKLDYHFVNAPELSEDDHRVLDAVHDYIDRTGATLLAEGIESKDHLTIARDVLGAQLGQGWFFGRPGPLPRSLPHPRRVVPFIDRGLEVSADSPWEIVSAASPADSLPEAAVRRQFAKVEQAAMMSREAPVVLASFPPDEGPWGTPAERLSRLRHQACFCGALGLGFARTVEEGWQTGPLAYGEEMSNEWVMVSIAAHSAIVVVAFDAYETDDQGHRLLEITSSEDRDVVADVAELMMRKLSAPPVALGGRLQL